MPSWQVSSSKYRSRLTEQSRNSNRTTITFTLWKKFNNLAIPDLSNRLQIKDLMASREQNCSSVGLLLYDSLRVRSVIASYGTSPAAQNCLRECFPTSGVPSLRLFVNNCTLRRSKYPDWLPASPDTLTPFVRIHEVNPVTNDG